MDQPVKAATALEVEGPQHDGRQRHHSSQHKSVPRWLRMSIRTAILVGLISVPTLAVKDPCFEQLTKYK